MHRADQCGRQLALNLLRTQLFEKARFEVTCVVDEDIDPPEVIERSLDGGLGVLWVRDIELDREQISGLA